MGTTRMITRRMIMITRRATRTPVNTGAVRELGARRGAPRRATTTTRTTSARTRRYRGSHGSRRLARLSRRQGRFEARRLHKKHSRARAT